MGARRAARLAGYTPAARPIARDDREGAHRGAAEMVTGWSRRTAGLAAPGDPSASPSTRR